MKMNLFQSKFRRGALLTAVLAVLLAVAVALLSVGSTAFLTTWEQLEQINEDYTITAIPTKDVDRIDGWNTGHSDLITEDRRAFLSACVEGCEPLTPFELDDFSSPYANFFDRALSVLAVRCTEAEEYVLPPEEDFPAVYSYHPYFELIEEICLFSSIQEAIPQESREAGVSLANTPFLTADRQIPFEVGKTYLLFGFCMGPGICVRTTEIGEDGSRWNVRGPIVLDVSYHGNMQSKKTFENGLENDFPATNGIFSWVLRSKGPDVYTYMAEESMPFYAEYTGSWEDFLASEEGRIWREEIIPLCQLNYESAHVVLTGNVDSMYMFNTGAATMLEGRKFEEEEYAGGADVCLVSAAYAQKNGLSLGDVLHLDLYRSGLDYTLSGSGRDEEVWLMAEPCRPENRIDVQKEYTIVGIYTAPEFSSGRHSFSANTIFAPKTSVPNAEAYEDIANKALYSVVLEPGAEEEFEGYLGAGFRSMFEFFDQGHSELVAAYEAVNTNALRLLGVSAAAFVLAGALFLLLSLRRLGPTARSMRLLGVKSGQVWREITEALGTLILISAAAGGVLGAALYGTVTERVIASSVALRPGVLVLCTLLLAVVLFLAAALCALPLARRSLMRTGGRRKK